LADGNWDWKLPDGLTDEMGNSPIVDLITPEIVGVGGSAKVTLTPSATYPLMRVLAHVMTDDTANDELYCTMNNDTATSNYHWAFTYWSGTTTTVGDTRATGGFQSLTRLDADVNDMAMLDMLIFNGDDSSEATMFGMACTTSRGSTLDGRWRGVAGIELNAALSTLEFFFNQGNIVEDSRFLMYGYDI